MDDIVRPGASWLEVRFGRFPSTHSAVMSGAASALAAFVPAAALPGFTVAVLVCHERIYRAQHFPSDIFAGVWIGLLAARFVIAQLARRGWRDDLALARRERRIREAADSGTPDKTRGAGAREPAA